MAFGPAHNVDGVRRHIVGFHQDDVGDWVADLACLHRVHVRHQPPFQDQPWVLDAARRAERSGTDFDCVLCDVAEMPHDMRLARTAGPYTTDSLLAGLRLDHRVATRTWALLRVVAGTATISMDVTLDRAVRPRLERVLVLGGEQAIPPDVVHRVTLDPDAVIEIDFLARDV